MRVLIVEDDPDFAELLQRSLRRHQHDVTVVGSIAAALSAQRQTLSEVAVIDLQLPDGSGLELLQRWRQEAQAPACVVLTGVGSIPTAVEAIKLGAFDYLTKPFPLSQLEARCEQALVARRSGQMATPARSQEGTELGWCAAMQDLQRLIRKVADTPLPVLILGETGVGKTLVAEALHRCSRRASGPFITVDCATLPETLIESELFGHERGAFTGAAQSKPGLVELADGGTLFIDEIGELPLMLQPKLLRLLETSKVRRVGSTQEKQVDVRIVAATHRQLPQLVQAGTFREDLWYRIQGFPLHVPPLRERREDLPQLIARLLPPGWCVDPQALQALQAYSWPGNVRQLKSVLERARVLAERPVITLAELPAECQPPTAQTAQAPEIPSNAHDLSLDHLERRHVLSTLAACGGNKTLAAQRLGIPRRTLYRWLQRYQRETTAESSNS
ncbi:MAG: sigma-54-dependent Fis family transcriptional regulator [Planctomycetaceae bacterium]|nr:MAG: sigma-54-dependent Fis family transcriptional regulator [Planctomycetaceae bacterium]